ncbi:type II restriction endonuclease [Mycoplasma enhydrae]|uniref:type II restriction endonuclease n=1 Tax=Mycoplasma enhydrae TaxID=2499220 RepID=UPI0021E763A2|nr:type II restriction endonuclease [Mycoplasma enhydrae]MCV3733746.1 type II restriction endonuclease [Mycoplasma enhydrae]
MKRNFNDWIQTMSFNILSYEYYVDFEKVYKNTNDLKIHLNLLNSLIGAKEIEGEFRELITKYPEVLKTIPILLAKRKKEIVCWDGEINRTYNFSSSKNATLNTVDDYCYFMNKTGLFNLISNHIINNLYDYVMGVEVGLNSNARKNRTGHIMENLVEYHIQKMGFKKDKTYFKEMNVKEIEEKFNLNLNEISNDGKLSKRFDFVFKSNNIVYACECNYYNNKGSKINETAGHYKEIARNAKKIKNFKFIWFTDGFGWTGSKKILKDVFWKLNIYIILMI